MAAGLPVWEEQIGIENRRTYAAAAQPVSPPVIPPVSKSAAIENGISALVVNVDGTLVASKCDATPTTVWIWSLSLREPVAVLIHHSPVKHLQWHKETGDLLLIQCAIPQPSLHFWCDRWVSPKVIAVDFERVQGRLEACWLRSADANSHCFFLSSASAYRIQSITDSGDVAADTAPASNDLGPELFFDEGHSADFSPIKLDDLGSHRIGGFGAIDDVVEDTFQNRRTNRTVND